MSGAAPALRRALMTAALPLALTLALTATPRGAANELDRYGIAGLAPLPSLRPLTVRHGVRGARLVRAAAFGRYRCGPAHGARLAAAIDGARAAFRRYPPTLARRVGLRALIFCAGLRDRDGRRPGGVPNLRAGALLLDLTSLPGDAASYRGALHHELFHFIDAADGGYRDRDWPRYNPMGFQYYGSDRRGFNASGALGSGGAAFVSAYARASVAEDKAELFRWLLTDRAAVAALAAADAGLRAKIATLERQLRRFEPALDHQFWNRERYEPSR